MSLGRNVRSPNDDDQQCTGDLAVAIRARRGGLADETVGTTVGPLIGHLGAKPTFLRLDDLNLIVNRCAHGSPHRHTRIIGAQKHSALSSTYRPCVL